MTDENLTSDIEELIAEVIEDKEERDFYLKLVPQLEQDELEELAEMLERQGAEKEALFKKQQLELTSLADEFDKEWNDAEEETDKLKAQDAVAKAPDLQNTPSTAPVSSVAPPPPVVNPTPATTPPPAPTTTPVANPFADLGQ